MTVTVGAYSLCDGTLAGGVAVSDLRVNQRRIADIVPVLPASYRIKLLNPGTGYVVGDELSIVGSGAAIIQVSLIGASGEIVNFRVESNTFNQDEFGLLASGGAGSGAIFSVLESTSPNRSSTLAYNRIGRPCVYAFTVKRTHQDLDAAELFILRLEEAIPSIGAITVTTTGPAETTFTIPKGKVQIHELVQQQGATTFHSYSIVGGPPTT